MGLLVAPFATCQRRDAIRIVGGENVRWPLVHCEDLANPYVLTLEGGVTRASYIGAVISGFR